MIKSHIKGTSIETKLSSLSHTRFPLNFHSCGLGGGFPPQYINIHSVLKIHIDQENAAKVRAQIDWRSRPRTNRQRIA